MSEERVLILGGSGLLGRGLLRKAPGSVEIFAPSHADLPMEDTDRLAQYLERHGIRRILLSAAWTHVDGCESDPDRAALENAEYPRRVAGVAFAYGLPLTFVSTDYVFGGGTNRPYRTNDPIEPRGVYASSKRLGESRVVAFAGTTATIVRTGALYGQGGPDFVHTMIRLLRQGTVRVVTDQIVGPTWVDDLAVGLWQVLLRSDGGIFHLAAPGETSWFEFARAIAVRIGVPVERVLPTTSEEFARPAPRPAYSVLDCTDAEETFGVVLPNWERGLDRFLGEVDVDEVCS